jgi:hypothetical protein
MFRTHINNVPPENKGELTTLRIRVTSMDERFGCMAQECVSSTLVKRADVICQTCAGADG